MINPPNRPAGRMLTDDSRAMNTLSCMWEEGKSAAEIARMIGYPLRVVRLTIDQLIKDGTLKPKP